VVIIMAINQELLASFVAYCDQHIRGDEKSEAQSFLNKFFEAFGHGGAIAAGATFEERVKKASAKGKMFFWDVTNITITLVTIPYEALSIAQRH
jgi:hypothetical protein